MKQFARTLEKCRSFKVRQKLLSESLDYLSYEYPHLYSLLYKEMRRRQLEINDPNNIDRWLNVPQQNAYIKLHEALLLVKNHNVFVIQGYQDTVEKMLCQTIEHGTNVEVSMKICILIERFAHLKSIHGCLFHHIRLVKELYGNMYGYSESNSSCSFRVFSQLNIQSTSLVQQPQLQHISVFPNMFYPVTVHGLPIPYINLNCGGHNYMEMIATTNVQSLDDFPQTIPNQTVVSQEMDDSVMKWLRYLKLHKYYWFFIELSYFDIELIDEDNIEMYIIKVNKNTITKGARRKICVSAATLRKRQEKLKNILTELNLKVSTYKLYEIISYMQDILHYPIPNENCVIGDQLQQDIVFIMEKYLNQLLGKLCTIKCVDAKSPLGTSVNKYLECSVLVTGNFVFTKDQVERTQYFSETLRYKVFQVHRNLI